MGRKHRAKDCGRSKRRKEYIEKDAVPESVPEAISLEKSKDIEEEETAFDFEHILSKLEKVQKEEQDRILQELLTFWNR